MKLAADIYLFLILESQLFAVLQSTMTATSSYKSRVIFYIGDEQERKYLHIPQLEERIIHQHIIIQETPPIQKSDNLDITSANSPMQNYTDYIMDYILATLNTIFRNC